LIRVTQFHQLPNKIKQRNQVPRMVQMMRHHRLKKLLWVLIITKL